MDSTEMQNWYEEEGAVAFNMGGHNSNYTDPQQSIEDSDQFLSDQDMQEQEIPTQDNIYTAEENSQCETISQQAGSVPNQNQDGSESSSDEREYDSVSTAHDSSSFDMEVDAAAKKRTKTRVKLMKKKYESQINLSKTNNRIDCLKSKNEYTEKAIDEHQNVLCEVMQKLVVEELDNTLQKYKEVKKNIANCWRTCENLEGESTGRQWNLDQLNILNEKADQLIQSIDAHKSDLANMHQTYVRSNKHFTEPLTQLQKEQDRLPAKLSDRRVERNRRDNIMSSKKVQSVEETQQIIDIKNLPSQGLQQKKMYQEKLSGIDDYFTAQKIKIKERAYLGECEIKEMEVKLQSLPTINSGLENKRKLGVAYESDIIEKGKQRRHQLFSQKSSLDKKEIEIQTSLATIYQDNENQSKVLKVTKENNYPAATQEQLLIAETDLKKETDIAKDKIKLEQKGIAYEKELKHKMVTKSAHLNGLEDSVYKTRCQNEREFEKIKSSLDSLKLKDDNLRAQCEFVVRIVKELKRRNDDLQRQKEEPEKSKSVPSKPTRQHYKRKFVKKMTFETYTSSGSSCEEHPEYAAVERKRFLKEFVQKYRK